MSEEKAIKTAELPRTRESIARDLLQLGVKPGMTVIVHSSLSVIGWVCGGPIAVIQALMDVITTDGTIVMPAHSGHYSEPSYWQSPPVPEHWWDIIRETMPAYEPETAPTRGMGVIAEAFRTWPGVIRSAHPQLSFTAWGKDAVKITEGHSLDLSLGENSPLARIYVLDGFVLLLGVGHANNTSLHLAEYRAPGAVQCENGAPVIEDGQRHWKVFKDIEMDSEVFDKIGEAYEEKHTIAVGAVGSAPARLFKQREAVDFAQHWLSEYRKTLLK